MSEATIPLILGLLLVLMKQLSDSHPPKCVRVGRPVPKLPIYTPHIPISQ